MKENNSELVLGMPFFKGIPKVNIPKFLSELKEKWKMNISEVDGDPEALSIIVNNDTILIGHVDSPFPKNELDKSFELNKGRIYLPDNITGITNHYVFSLISKSIPSPLEEYLTFTKVLNSFLNNSNAEGVYFGENHLIFSKEYYINTSNEMVHHGIPIELWVYFGIENMNDKITQFTKGLKSFSKLEMVIDVDMNLDEGYNLLYSIAAYIISNDIILNDQSILTFDSDNYIVVIDDNIIYIVQ